MKSKLWNGGFLRTVLQGLAVTCAALLALSALGAGLTLGGVIGQQQLSAAAVVISFLGVLPGAWLTAQHAAGPAVFPMNFPLHRGAPKVSQVRCRVAVSHRSDRAALLQSLLSDA